MTMHDQTAGTQTTVGASGGPDRSGAAGTAKQAAGEAARDVATTAREDARTIAEQARTEAQRLKDQAKQELQRQADDRGQQAATRLRTFSDQLEALVQGRTEEAGPLVGYAERARDQMRGWASRIDERGPQALVSDVSGFARRRPGMFLLAAAGAGFAIGRLVRAEREVQHEDESARQMYAGEYGGVSPQTYGTSSGMVPPAEPIGTGATVGSPTAASMIPRSSDG